MAKAQFGSVSSGTMRPEDLIPCFLDELDELDPEVAGKIEAEYPSVGVEGDYDGEAADYMLEALFDALDDCAPTFGYFGANEGDGADYGFWLSQGALDEAVHDGTVIKVDAGDDREERRQADKDSGAEYYLEVNDRGNMTLLTIDGEELWSLV